MIEHEFDITKYIRQGANEVIVKISSPIVEAEKQADKFSAAQRAQQGCYEALSLRRPVSSYGWDILCRAVTSGIWRGVYIEYRPYNSIRQFYVSTNRITKQNDTNSAYLDVIYQIRTDVNEYKDLSLKTEIYDGDKIVCCHTHNIWFVTGRYGFRFDNCNLWYPHGYGDAYLYTVKVSLMRGETVMDTYSSVLGVRTAELKRTDKTSFENPGDFRFIINGVPVMCKGSNWVPLDAFHSNDANRYDEALRLFSDTNCNIVRCWGGNVYEDHAFFDLCDKYGIMVWQDFSMACALYPRDSEFYEQMETEAKSVIRKLRGHPSIVLWAGDNECDYLYLDAGLNPNANHLTRTVLKTVAENEDPARPYLPSSPYFSPEAVATGNPTAHMPEDHLWGVRDSFKSEFYHNKTVHFISETGYHGCPSLSSLKKFLSPDKIFPYKDNDEWILHSSDAFGRNGQFAYRVELMANQIKEYFGECPDSIEDFILASQINQAEAKKHFIETTRLAKWRRTGIIWWNMIDGWPQFSDAVVDYYFNKKLAYYYIKRAQEPICVMVCEPNNWYSDIRVANDTLTAYSGNYRLWDGETGEVLAEGRFTSPPNGIESLSRIRVSRGEKRLILIEWEIGGKKSFNHYIHGNPPFRLEQYKGWLELIAGLDDTFNYDEIGK
jgi:beta-mannosidase